MRRELAAQPGTPRASVASPPPWLAQSARVACFYSPASGRNESPGKKLLVGAAVAWVFELAVGHSIEFLKIKKQTSNLPYVEIVRGIVAHKGVRGLWDGFFPWGTLQAVAKGASFSFGHSTAKKMLKGHFSDSVCEVLAGGIGGAVQGFALNPLLLLKTRVMTDPAFRQSGGLLATAAASSKLGLQIMQREGPLVLMKGSVVFSGKRVMDWTTRFFFAEVVTSAWRSSRNGAALSTNEQAVATLLGGSLSAIATIPLDVLVATVQDAAKAGQKVHISRVLMDKVKEGGLMSLARYSSRGTIARVAHVGLTTLLMKDITNLVYWWVDGLAVGGR